MLPSVFRVMGSYLHNRNNKVEAYKKLFDWLRDGEDFSCDKEYSFDDSRILFAYYELGHSAQEAFLDICSFFPDWKWDEVACIVGEEELDCLEDGALVKRIEVEEGYEFKIKVERISIHDLILTAGRNKSKDNRFRSAHDFSMAMANEGVLRQTKGVSLESRDKPFHISAEALDAMSESLRVFAIGPLTIVDGQCRKVFDKLIFLRARTQHKQLPVRFGELSAVIRLDLMDCGTLQELPCDFEKLSALQSLNLSNCSSLLRLSEGLGNLPSLKYINVNGCKKLRNLPHRVAERCLLKGRISFNGCSDLKEIPEDICKLKMLTNLSLEGCRSLKMLPIGFAELTCLQELVLEQCTSLQQLGNEFHCLVGLRTLNMSGCKSLSRLPQGLGCLGELEYLELSRCKSLCKLPDCFGKLGALERLVLSGCDKIEKLCSDFGCLGALKDLDLSGCNSISNLPDCFGRLGCLERLDLSGCCKFQELSSDFYCLRSLARLGLSRCESLGGEWMDIVGTIESLWRLDIIESERLIKRWNEMQREEKQWHFAVVADSCWEETAEGHSDLLLRGMISKVFDEEGLMIDIHQRPFHLSCLPPDTSLILIIQPYKKIDGEFLEKYMEQAESSSKALKIIYVGEHFIELPSGVTDRILAYTPPDSLFLDKFRATFPSVNLRINVFRSNDGLEEKGIKCPSTWDNISYIVSEIASLLSTPRESNVEILRAALQTDFLLINNTQQMRVTDLQGKVILLLYASPMFEGSYPAFREMYVKMRDTHHHLVEVVWIPFWNFDQWDEFKRAVTYVPWPVVLKNTSSDFLFLAAAPDNSIGLPRAVVVDDKGRISHKDALGMIERWGVEAYPFSQAREEELRKSEWEKAFNSNHFPCSNLQIYKSY